MLIPRHGIIDIVFGLVSDSIPLPTRWHSQSVCLLQFQHHFFNNGLVKIESIEDEAVSRRKGKVCKPGNKKKNNNKNSNNNKYLSHFTFI